MFPKVLACKWEAVVAAMVVVYMLMVVGVDSVVCMLEAAEVVAYTLGVAGVDSVAYTLEEEEAAETEAVCTLVVAEEVVVYSLAVRMGPLVSDRSSHLVLLP